MVINRNPKRIPKILKELSKVWQKYPDLRFGQLLMNCYINGTDLYYIEDEQLIKKLNEVYGK
jgi:uncharacterized protein YihD (DUF1040 family)